MCAVKGFGVFVREDIVLAKDLGYTIKLLAVAKDKEEGIELGVYPSFIPERHPLAAVSDTSMPYMSQDDRW